MILSDRQYSVAKAQLEKLRSAAEHAKADAATHLRLREIEVKALASQIADIERELAEYDLAKSGTFTFAESFSLSDLPKVLIQARIARGLSQTDLAHRLNMKPQQIQRYEATEYTSASLARLIEIAAALDVKVSQSFVAEDGAPESAIFVWRDAEDVDFTRFPLREMEKRGWFKATHQNRAAAARNYFLSVAGRQFATAHHRKKVRGSNAPNEHALLAWQARVLELAKGALDRRKVAEFELNDTWVSELVGLTRHSRGPVRARELLADYGIVLVIERHLTGTYLDGAAMMSAAGYPVIGLTLRYDRLDNFWFVLFHELGHVFLHLFRNLRLDFFDEEDGSDADEIEVQADRFALDRLIPDVVWKQCLSRFALSEESVRIDAERLGIDPSIIAGRIRRERKNYTILNELIGSGTVRAQLERNDA